MKLFQHILTLCIFNTLVVIGEEMFLLTLRGKLYWYNTKNKATKQIAQKVALGAMACDYERKWLYLAYDRDLTTIVRARMDSNVGDMKTITEKDKDDSHIKCLGVDQETGDVYYASIKGLVFLSYKKNYTKTVISTSDEVSYTIDVGVHGEGPNKRVYWSTATGLYTSQTGNPQLTELDLSCIPFSILDNGIVCTNIDGVGLYLAKLDGMTTESLPNVTIKSSSLNEIDCKVTDATTLDGKLYLVCSDPPIRILRINLQANTPTVVITAPTLSKLDRWKAILPLPDHKVILPEQTVEQTVELPSKTLPDSTIMIIVIAVVIGIVLIVILAVTIHKCTKKRDSLPRRSDIDQTDKPTDFSRIDNRQKEYHVYTTLASTEYLELNTLPSSNDYVEVL